MTELLPVDTDLRTVKLRIDDYEMLSRAGALDAYSRTELIDGGIFSMNAQHRPHGIVKMELYDRLRDVLRVLGSEYRPVIEFSLALPPHDMPDPDLMLTSEPRGDGAVPLQSVALVIEVSDTTLSFDLREKAELYARYGLPEYWVADVNARQIHQMWLPDGGKYTEHNTIAFGEHITNATMPQMTIETSGLS